MDTKKVVILSVPAFGHINPIVAVAIKILKETNFKVIIYGTEELKMKIQDSGAIYMDLDFKFNDNQRNLKNNTKSLEIFPMTANILFDAVITNSLKIADFFEEERPDLVIYDNMCIFAKWALRILKARRLNFMPKVFSYHTSFIQQKGVFPNATEEQILMNSNFFERIKFYCVAAKLTFRSLLLSFKYGIEFIDIKSDFICADSSLINIAFIFPFLQKRSELFHENVKFVGACIDDGPHLEDLRNVKDDSIKKFLERFQPRNPSSIKSTENFLIYVSLGSMFTDNFDFYLKVIEAYKIFAAQVKSEKIFAIINVGEVCFDEFNERNHDIPQSIKLVPFAPQLEILKRASIFVTHCGMNSTSESIWFGVPMICMPVSLDQPLIASRIANELCLGILLNLNDFKIEELAKCFHKFYSDDSFHKKSFEYSQISLNHNGVQLTCEIIKNIL